MPLFKRRQDKEEQKPEQKPEKEEPSEEEKSEAEEGEEEKTPEEAEEGSAGETGEGSTEEETPSKEDDDSDEEDDDEMSIDDLLEAAGTADRPQEMEESLGDLTVDDVHLVKMARKVVVIGDPAVGKTSLIKRFVQDVFDDRYLNTIGAKVMKKELGVNRPDTGEIVDLKLILWDIAGQESFDTVKKAYYRGASGAIVVCDLTRKDTMEHLHKWIENLFDVSDVIPMAIICNKNDLGEEVEFNVEDAEAEFAPYGAPVYTTSAKLGENVEMVFHELGKMISK